MAKGKRGRALFEVMSQHKGASGRSEPTPSKGGIPTPKWKHTARLSLNSGPVTLSGQWRYIGKVSDDDPTITYGVEHFKAQNYFDLTSLFDIGEHYQLAVGVSNLFNKKPPLGASFQNGGNVEQSNTFPTVYDVLGRSYFASARLKF